MKRHILICGDVGVGKSTLIQKLLHTVDLPIYGFITKRLPSGENGFHPIYIHPAGEPENARRRTAENLIGTCNGRIHDIHLETFNTVGAELLRTAKPDGCIVMDELGFMEAKADVFTQAVFDALDGDIPILAAVKSRTDIPFLEKVRNHPNASVYQITVENRDSLCDMLLPVVKSWATQLNGEAL